MRSRFFGLVVMSAALLGALPSPQSNAGGYGKSASVVEATAIATRPDAAGKQSVTITLDIKKGYYLYANPVKLDILEGSETRVAITAKTKPISVTIVYPKSKTKLDGKLRFEVYEGAVKIQAKVQRAIGDKSPLEIAINVHASPVCFFPSRIKLTIP